VIWTPRGDLTVDRLGFGAILIAGLENHVMTGAPGPFG
jgi:hypothetical protein